MACALGVAAMACGGVAQDASQPDLFVSVKPYVSVLVQPHPMGAEVVTVTALDPQYPPALLQKQVDAMCSELNSPARGLAIYTTSLGDSDKLDFLKARFGTTGLILGSGRFNVQAVAKAFAGAPAPFTLHGISVVFDSQTPTSDTLRDYESPSVLAQARFTEPPASGVEFRILLRDQNPAAIEIPDHYAPPPAPAPRAAPASQFPWPIWAPLGVAAFGVGALVYLAFLRVPSPGKKSPPGVPK